VSAPTKPAKKPAAKKSPRAARPAPSAAEPEITDEEEGLGDPVVIGTPGPGDAPVETVPVTVVGGVEYRIPRNPSAGLVLSWMLDIEEHGAARAALRMAGTLLGKETMAALARSPQVTPDHIEKIFGRIAEVFFNSDNYRKIVEAADPS
jgi:hypothetical protein